MRHAARIFENETIHLDGQLYLDCEFRRCRLIYSGGEMPGFDVCQFQTCTWHLEGAALRTLDFLSLLYGTGNKPLVEGILRRITGTEASRSAP